MQGEVPGELPGLSVNPAGKAGLPLAGLSALANDLSPPRRRYSIFRKGVDLSHRSLRSFPPKKAARNSRQKVHSIAKNALKNPSVVFYGAPGGN